MKKIFLIVTVAIFQISISLGQSRLYIGGAGNYNLEKFPDETYSIKQHTIYFYPTIGIHLNTNWIIGISGEIEKNESAFKYNTLNFQNEGSNSSQTLGGGFFIRKRHPLSETIGLYAHIFVGFSEYSQTRESDSNPSDEIRFQKGYILTKSYQTGLQTGIEIKLSKKWMVNAKFGEINYENIVPQYEDLFAIRAVNISFRPSALRISMLYYIF